MWIIAFKIMNYTINISQAEFSIAILVCVTPYIIFFEVVVMINNLNIFIIAIIEWFITYYTIFIFWVLSIHWVWAINHFTVTFINTTNVFNEFLRCIVALINYTSHGIIFTNAWFIFWIDININSETDRFLLC